MTTKVLHIITQLELGGAQKNVLDILSRLDQKRFQIHLISSNGLLTKEAASIPGLNLTLLPFLRRNPNPIFDLAAFLAIIFYIRRNKIQVVHTHSSKAGILGRWAARAAGVRVIIHTVHGWGFHDYFKSFFNDLYIFMERLTARITTKLIVVSEGDIQKGLANKIGSKDQYLVVRCGIDWPAFDASRAQKDDIRRSLGIKEDDLVVEMVACLKPQKNPLDFVRSAGLILKENPRVKFFLAGDGALRSSVERAVIREGMDKSFFMLGWRKDIAGLMSVCDVFVLTSLWEGLPLVLLEAMSSSKPIVAYDTGGASEVVKDGVNGFLVRPKDFRALASKISLLLDNDERRLRMGKFGRNMICGGAFEFSSMMARLSSLYEESNASNLQKR